MLARFPDMIVVGIKQLEESAPRLSSDRFLGRDRAASPKEPLPPRKPVGPLAEVLDELKNDRDSR